MIHWKYFVVKIRTQKYWSTGRIVCITNPIYELGNVPYRCRQIYWIGRVHMSYDYAHVVHCRAFVKSIPSARLMSSWLLNVIITRKKKTCISPSYIFSINWHNLSTTSTMSRWYSWTTGKLYVVLLFRKNVK